MMIIAAKLILLVIILPFENKYKDYLDAVIISISPDLTVKTPLSRANIFIGTNHMVMSSPYFKLQA